MYAFLHKLLTLKGGGEIRHLSWSSPDGWLAFGGGEGGVTILNTKAILAKEAICLMVAHGDQPKESELLNYQTLIHTGKPNVTLQVACWSPVQDRFTMLDDSGCFTVWKRENNIWVNEVLSSGTWKGVVDCAVSPDGQKLCFLCMDGRLSVCSKDGQKLWSKDLKRRMRHILWSPTGLELLLCSEAGEMCFYDSEGFYTHPFHPRQGGMEPEDKPTTVVRVAGVDWYHGDQCLNVNPALAIAYENGRIEISVGDTGGKILSFVAHFNKCTAVAWRPTGGVLAVLGVSALIHPLVPANREVNGEENGIIRFYSTEGELLHTLVLPEGRRAQRFRWNNVGDKIVVACTDALLFAEIRSRPVAAYFKRTVVYIAPASEKNKQCLWFWNTDRHSKHRRVVDKVLHIQTTAESCLVVTEALSCDEHRWWESTSSQYTFTIYSSSGNAKRKFESSTVPQHIAFTENHILAAYAQTLRLWAYNFSPSRSPPHKEYKSSLSVIEARKCGCSASSAEQTQQHERTAPSALSESNSTICSPPQNANNTCSKTLTFSDAGQEISIVALTANACGFIVAMKYGEIRGYSLPAVELHYRYTLKTPPLTIQTNSDGSRLAVVDVLHIFRIYGAFPAKSSRAGAAEKCELDILFERPDVSYVIWATDIPDSFAMAQKNMFYVVRGTDMEEVIQCSASLLNYSDLCLHGVYFDRLVEFPSSLNSNPLYEYRTKALRDTEAMLQNPHNLRDGLSYVSQKPHPILWNLLARAALESLTYAMVEEAYTRCQDYFGVLSLKYLSDLDKREKQVAEVYACLGKVDKAQQRNMSAGRVDIALASKSTTITWSQLLELCRERGWGPKADQQALKELAESHKDSGSRSEAIRRYWQMQKEASLTRSLYATQQCEAAYNMVAHIPEGGGHPLYIGQKLVYVGMGDEAITTFQKTGHVEFAHNVCSKFEMRNIASHLPYDPRFLKNTESRTQLEMHPLQSDAWVHAVRGQEGESSPETAVKVLIQRAISSNSSASPPDPVKSKMVYLLAALLAETFVSKKAHQRRSLLECAFQDCPPKTRNSFIKPLHAELDSGVQGPRRLKELDESDEYNYDEAALACWGGAEAFHLYILYHEHLSTKRFKAAVCAAARLTHYADYIKTYVAYEMLALASYYAQNWHTCSTALMRLESITDSPLQRKASIDSLAVNIFSSRSPVVPALNDTSTPACPSCHARLGSWDIMCRQCGICLPFCLGSGKPFSPSNPQCRVCSL